MADTILANGSNVARKNKIVLKINDTEIGIITKFTSSESRTVTPYFTYGGDVENAKCLIPELVKDKTLSVAGLVLFKKDLLEVLKDSSESNVIDTLTKQLTPFTIEEYNKDVSTGNTKVTTYEDCLFQNLNIDSDLSSGNLAIAEDATIVYRKKSTEFKN